MYSDPYAHDELCHSNDPWGGVCSCGAAARFAAEFHGPQQATALVRAMIALRARLHRPGAAEPFELPGQAPVGVS